MRKGISKLPMQGPQEVHYDFLGAVLFKYTERFLAGTYMVLSYLF